MSDKHFTQDETIFIATTVVRGDIDPDKKAKLLLEKLRDRGWTAKQVATFCARRGNDPLWAAVVHCLRHPKSICSRCSFITDEEIALIQQLRDGKKVEDAPYPTDRTVSDKRLYKRLASAGERIREPITDASAHRIRYLIEKRFAGGLDKKGNQVGLQLSSADVFAAITQVSYDNPYHPVREYLLKQVWDGQSYVERVVKILGAEDTTINRVIVKKFFISAVARPLQPGCKVDTVFIIVGEQGLKKSTFFRVLSDPWFIDTTIDISSDPVRAYMTMRKAWILEWAELESLFRARNASSAKAFLSSSTDSYVPKHARFPVDIKRSGVIVGTINPDEFLSDDTGHRRFWPLKISDRVDYEAIAAIRHQLWAEAVHLFQAGEPWWLSEEEERLLVPRHGEHEVSDAWADPILAFVSDKASVSVQDVLSHALCIEKGRWTDREVKRVCRVLKASGQWKPDPNKQKGKPRLWITTGVVSGGEKDESL